MRFLCAQNYKRLLAAASYSPSSPLSLPLLSHSSLFSSPSPSCGCQLGISCRLLPLPLLVCIRCRCQSRLSVSAFRPAIDLAGLRHTLYVRVGQYEEVLTERGFFLDFNYVNSVFVWRVDAFKTRYTQYRIFLMTNQYIGFDTLN